MAEILRFPKKEATIHMDFRIKDSQWEMTYKFDNGKNPQVLFYSDKGSPKFSNAVIEMVRTFFDEYSVKENQEPA